jgi:hypothetical protein
VRWNLDHIRLKMEQSSNETSPDCEDPTPAMSLPWRSHRPMENTHVPFDLSAASFGPTMTKSQPTMRTKHGHVHGRRQTKLNQKAMEFASCQSSHISKDKGLFGRHGPRQKEETR